MKSSLFGVFIFVLTACASAPKSERSASIESLITQAKNPNYAVIHSIGEGDSKYSVLAHSPVIRPLLKENYASEDRDAIRYALGTSLDFAIDSRGLARAGDRVEADEANPNYSDAVSVRESLWVYLSLRANPEDSAKAKRLLLTLADYFSSPAQIARFDAVVENPLILNTPEGGMKALHVRFDRRSAEFADVTENGKPQTWNHKQNDALGLFLDLFCRAVLEGELKETDLTAERIAMVKRFPVYFNAVKFEAMADAGSWEELERVNTSSVALVTSGLERLALAYRSFPGLKLPLILGLIDRGYRTIEKQIAAGGESPAYAPEDRHFRQGDAALLNLIYPARLSRLRRKHYEALLRAVSPLIGEIGIKRYREDPYQSGNFWFQAVRTDESGTEPQFSDRGSRFIEGTEAQWFFDSWYSIATAGMAKRYKDAHFAATSTRFLNRALAQITGGTPESPVLGADGKPVPRLALPESYNTIVDPHSKDRADAPSPVTPLNWAKAAMRLAL